MAKSNAVWGIDIGQCALKALRCSFDSRTNELVAEAFDYIEYPKILSQPDADPQQLVREALKQFLSRNVVRGDGVAISVPGQQGLARFIKLPPVELKKIPDIVKYEAKQQIPFALEDVIWDYQTLVGGGDLDGMALETEVGLFAMKRDQVFRAIRPLDDAGIELDVIQLAPISVLNAVVHAELGPLGPLEEYDPDDPQESVVILSMGTDTTDLVITNGYKVWQRSVPLGGNHFTKQLTKELKLTFGQAEHLKRNSREAEDPKKIFQAMRSVFNDMVTEVQRSIGFFQSLNRTAKIGRIVALGNAFKLPGLEQYLEKNLGHKVKVIQGFEKLTGTAVLNAPAFKDNASSFGVCYGLCLQGLTKSKLLTNLVPRELIRARLIRRKKPWVLAGTSLMLAGMALSFLMYFNRWSEVDPVKYQEQTKNVSTVKTDSDSKKSQDAKNQEDFAKLKAIGDQVVGGAERRFMMLELFKAVNDSLPRDPSIAPGQISTKPFEERPVLYIEAVESQFYGGEEGDLSTWFTEDVQKLYAESLAILNSDPTNSPQAPPAPPAGDAEAAAEEKTVAAAAEPEASDAAAEAEAAGEEESAADVGALAGSGWVIELRGHHYFNKDMQNSGAQYVRNTLIKNLLTNEVELPVGPGQPPIAFTMEEIGVSYPIIAESKPLTYDRIRNPDWIPPDPLAEEMEMMNRQALGLPGVVNVKPTHDEKAKKVEQFIKVRKHEFKVQFVWRPTTVSARLEKRRERQLQSESDAISGQVAGG